VWTTNSESRNTQPPAAINQTMSTDSDASVISDSLRDPERFELVFDRHFPTIYRYLRRRVGEDLARELVAETFLRAFQARDRSPAQAASALPWLYGIAANLLRMSHRREERRLRAYARAAAQEVAGTGDGGVEERLDAIALRPQLAGALAALSPALREVLMLHAWSELSHEEIAQALQCSPAAVRTRLHRARSQVESHLSAAGQTVPSDRRLPL
jgi:RNA polymerase sigma factor (sigma-70 family)